METTYPSIENALNTGDIVLFSGEKKYSRLIKRMSFSKCSHIGLVLRIPEYDFLIFLESTSLGYIKDLEFGEIRKGVQLVPLYDRIQGYDGNISARKLEGAELQKTT